MNILIMTDLEGISGIDKMEMVSEVGTPGHKFGLERLMLDVNAAVEGAYEGGTDAVFVVDGHGGGKNFIKEMLDPRAVQLESKDWQEMISSRQIDAYMEVGAHAMAGTINGFLDHTQNSKSWYNYYVNGRKSGEIAQGAIFTGALMAFTLSVDDFVISFFNTGHGVTNLSITIYSMAKKGINPSINAISAIMFTFLLILLLIINKRTENQKKVK